jgi:hypothetical protein
MKSFKEMLAEQGKLYRVHLQRHPEEESALKTTASIVKVKANHPSEAADLAREGARQHHALNLRTKVHKVEEA